MQEAVLSKYISNYEIICDRQTKTVVVLHKNKETFRFVFETPGESVSFFASIKSVANAKNPLKYILRFKGRVVLPEKS